MQILLSDKVVINYGTIDKGIFEEADPTRELYKITNENGTFYSVTENFNLHEVDSIPEDFTDGKYLWSEESGFELNPDWVDPSTPSETEQLRADVDYIAAMTGVELV